MTTTERCGASAAYREVLALTGPLLPVMSFLARLPTATIQFGSVLLVARTSGSLTAAGLTGGALAFGQVACGPLAGRLADRHGQRAVVLVFSLANALAIAGLVAGALAGLPTGALAALGTLAGATVPQIGPMARARLVALARRAGARDTTVGAALSFESTLDEISFVLGPALVGLAAVTAHPAYAVGGAAALVATCGTGFALHRTAVATGPRPGGPASVKRPCDVAETPRRAAPAGIPQESSLPARAGSPEATAPAPVRVSGAASRVSGPAGMAGAASPASAPVSSPEAAAPAPARIPEAAPSPPAPARIADVASPAPAAAGIAGAANSAPAAAGNPRAAVPPAPAPARTPEATSAAPTPPRIPRAVHPLRAALALQGAMFGACQAGITALTERLGQSEQAGLVYAAMGVMSAVAGLSMAAVPARFGLAVRWRAATAAACVLSLPLLWTGTLPALYVTVTVLGVAYAPHLITVFGLTERVVPPARLAESMALATSALVGGQALAVAVTGRLAESYGPEAAFGTASLTAAAACLIALTARPEPYTDLHARVEDEPPNDPT
ncbi:MFS transporter [Streptomyces lanatus]|uniref:MFS transporter n=1 Tax=Streptomyces lanatus TaxID=66900 RepID=A0ABV1XY58_9ACTN|nr:MFS transporter [Streptomyces lanatus]GHG89390.1 hypothetical protein GCM10018780_08660 [Streptomyces lanatus]